MHLTHRSKTSTRRAAAAAASARLKADPFSMVGILLSTSWTGAARRPDGTERLVLPADAAPVRRQRLQRPGPPPVLSPHVIERAAISLIGTTPMECRFYPVKVLIVRHVLNREESQGRLAVIRGVQKLEQAADATVGMGPRGHFRRPWWVGSKPVTFRITSLTVAAEPGMLERARPRRRG
jgi:hypothetical protein